MKIPKKVGYGLIATGIVGAAASTGSFIYFANKIGEIKENSPEYVRVAKIEQESSKLKDDLLVNCLENSSDEKSYSACVVQAANQYRSLQLEKKVLMQSDNYSKTEEKSGNYNSHMIGSSFGIFVLPLFFGFVGAEIILRRRRDEIEEMVLKLYQENGINNESA